MRCQKRPAADCPTSELCEIMGCQDPYGTPATALIPERRPIDLDYKPGKIMRSLMALTDRGAEVVKRGPPPFAALRAPDPALLQELEAVMSAPEAPPPKPAPPTEIRIVEIPGGWLVYRGQHPAAVAADPAALGARVAELVAR